MNYPPSGWAPGKLGDFVQPERLGVEPQSVPDLPYLVPGLRIPGGGTAPHMFGGYGFSGKSVVLQAALLATASGRPWWGRCGARALFL